MIRGESVSTGVVTGGGGVVVSEREREKKPTHKSYVHVVDQLA